MRVLMENMLGDRTDGATDQATGKSAASWPSVIAGAFVAAGSSLILLVLGAGLGFATVSPLDGRGISATAFTTTTAIWLIVTQWVAAALGGYIAGRLRTRWVGTHTHEVFFRDTAHGLVTWAVATVVMAALFGGSLSSLIGGGLRAAATGAAGTVAAGAENTANAAALQYGVDKLFRPAVWGTDPGQVAAPDPRPEATRILENVLVTGNVPDADRSYLADLIAARAGISHADAAARLADWMTTADQFKAQARQMADADRKAAALAALYTALSLLIGAFIASVTAALGGRLRDEYP